MCISEKSSVFACRCAEVNKTIFQDLQLYLFRECWKRNSRSGVQRSDDARGDCLIGWPLPNSSIQQWRMVVIVTRFTMFVTSQYDVIFTFVNQRFGEVCWHNVHVQGRRSRGREAVPAPRRAFCGLCPPQWKLQWSQIEFWSTLNRWSFIKFQNVKPPWTDVEPPIKTSTRRFCWEGEAVKQLRAMETYTKIVANYACFCSSTMLISKIIIEIIEKHSEFSGCPNSCNEFVSSRSW